MILVGFVILMLIAASAVNVHAARQFDRRPTMKVLDERAFSSTPEAPYIADEPDTRERGWMQTYSGRRFHPLEPRASDVELVDVAHGLAMTCRYGGQCRQFYSVAEHCVLVSEFVEAHARNAGMAAADVRKLAQLALMHDSAEAYIGDMIRPLKHQPEMIAFRDAETAIEREIAYAFGLVWTPEAHDIVKRIDDRILIDEISHLMPAPEAYLQTPLLRELSPLGARFHCMSPPEAFGMFMRRFREVFQ